MAEAPNNSAAPAYWEGAADGGTVDWERIFDGYRATFDFPASFFYRELAEAYPDAKAILTVRDPEAWFNSTQASVLNDDNRRKLKLVAEAKGNPDPRPMAERIVLGRFGGDIRNKERLILTFNEHNEEVRRTNPPDRLLVYEVGHGFEPHCHFLEPWPRRNQCQPKILATILTKKSTVSLQVDEMVAVRRRSIQFASW
jgi:hypothetical protein